MQPCVVITPTGHLRLEDGPAAEPTFGEDTAAALRRAFGQSSADGLLLLAGQEMDQELPADFVFWRSLARDFFQQVCHLGDAPIEQWTKVTPPAESERERLVASAPPMRGLEYLSP